MTSNDSDGKKKMKLTCLVWFHGIADKLNMAKYTRSNILIQETITFMLEEEEGRREAGRYASTVYTQVCSRDLTNINLTLVSKCS